MKNHYEIFMIKIEWCHNGSYFNVVINMKILDIDKQIKTHSFTIESKNHFVSFDNLLLIL
jgi:hypothetical protein